MGKNLKKNFFSVRLQSLRSHILIYAANSRHSSASKNLFLKTLLVLQNIKYKSFALFFAICISVILLFFTSTFIMSNMYDRLNIISFTKRHQLMLNVSSGVNLFLSNKANYPINQTLRFSPFGNEDSVAITHYKWGIFDVAAVKSSWKGDSEKKSVMTGEIIDTTIAFYISDNSSVLQFAGSATITGDCYLSEKGHKTTTVEGKSFYGKNAINGKIKKNTDLKLAYKELCDTISSHLYQFTGNIKLIPFANIQSDTLTNSFNDSTQIYYSVSSINLSNFNITGNIKIVSDHSINIDKTTKLTDAIIIAPFIYIDEGFIGKAQFFAKDSIIVEEDVELQYPSVLAVIKQKNTPSFQKIIINKDCKISGTVINYCENTDYTHQPITSLAENIVFKGQLLSNGIVSFKSNIDGQIFCGELFYSSSSSYYKNLITDNYTDITKLPYNFTGIQLISSKIYGNRLIKWLH